jgi:hypothetical protein
MIDCSMIGKVITHVGIFICKQQTKNSAHLAGSKIIEYDYKERLVLFVQCNTNDYSWSFLFLRYLLEIQSKSKSQVDAKPRMT